MVEVIERHMDTKVEMPERQRTSPRRATTPRAVRIGTRRTGISLEPELWDALVDIAAARELTIHQLVTEVFEHRRERINLTAAVRVYIVTYYHRRSNQLRELLESLAQAEQPAARPANITPKATS